MEELLEKLRELQKDLKSLKPNVKNTFFGSMYADLSSTYDYLLPKLAKAGLTLTHVTYIQDGQVILKTTLATGVAALESTWPVGPITSSQQQLGGALTYGKRYTTQSIVALGVEGEDDDAESTMNRQKEKPKNYAPKKEPVYAPPSLPDSDPEFRSDILSLPMFGKKYAGKTVGDIGLDKAQDYVNWLKGTVPKGAAAKFVEQFEGMLNGQPS